MRFYLYNNIHIGDNLYSRPLAKKLKELGHSVVIGCYNNMNYLFKDLEISIITANFNEGSGRLETLCPVDYTPIDTWLGHGWREGKFIGMTWQNMIELFNEQSPDFKLYYIPEETPFLDFNYPEWYTIRKAIYIDNSKCRGAHSFFEFDMEMLSNTFPDITFICTGQTKARNNVLDYSQTNIVDLARISEQCIAIFGKGSGPYVCTLTSKNIDKPRALCGLQGIFNIPNWPHPRDTTKYLNNMFEVVKMIKEIK
jgi:hypothetical protein